ncbi:MAG: tyrosine--tRNA ligase, partial [Candidatus Omnitrophica bacterium]|nr:tyrosine--tRNA ligase [Candidatus Omnitrophota bacterium]
ADLRWRGQIHQITDENLGPWLAAGSRTVYAGFDPTADSLHCGSLLPILMLAHFQRAGHRPIALAGGATGLIGDPSGKKEERTLMTPEQVQTNVEGISRVLGKFLDFEGEQPALLVNNYDWIGKFSFIEFIRDVGKHVRITEMLARDSVKSRMEGGVGLSFTEFSYQVLQAYDFHHLHSVEGCRVQVGGSDQWGNITAGTDLIRRLGGEQCFGLVCPLLTTSSGQKFGKTEEGAVWLTADRTSPYQFYQYWVRTEDADVVRLLKLFTFLPLEEIGDLEKEVSENPGARNAQKKLAWEVTSLVHGEEAAQAAINASQALFGGSLEGLDLRTLEDIFSEVPTFTIDPSKIEQGYPILDALVDSGLASSKGDARRAIKGGAINLNNLRIEADSFAIAKEHLLHDRLAVLRHGKKKYCLGRVE